MGTFIITQLQRDKNLYLIPSADGCNIELTPIGNIDNWKCVDDPITIPNDDTDYNYTNALSLKYDLYKLPNHTTETETINYVQVFARSKSHQFPQAETGIFKIILTENECTNIYKTDNIDLITSYAPYNHFWMKNPRTDNDWTWNDIDNIQIGVECNSPTTQEPTSNAFFRPDSTVIAELSSIHCSPPYHHNCVNHITPPDNTSVVVNNQTFDPSYSQADTFGLPNHNPTTHNGVITNIRFCCRIMEEQIEEFHCSGTASLIDTVNANNNDTILNFTSNWATTCKNYATNPATAAAWTWAEIDGLQAKIQMLSVTDDGGLKARAYCNNLYIIVSYIRDVNPDIRTTQCYAKVNYTPIPITCTLNKPEDISIDHSMNIKTLNFWSGNREVYSLSRSGKSMVLTGSEYQSDICSKACPCERIACIKNMGKDGSTITISGLRSLFNGEFKIRSFGWKKISKKPEYYEWILELEYND